MGCIIVGRRTFLVDVLKVRYVILSVDRQAEGCNSDDQPGGFLFGSLVIISWS